MKILPIIVATLLTAGTFAVAQETNPPTSNKPAVREFQHGPGFLQNRGEFRGGLRWQQNQPGFQGRGQMEFRGPPMGRGRGQMEFRGGQPGPRGPRGPMIGQRGPGGPMRGIMLCPECQKQMQKVMKKHMKYMQKNDVRGPGPRCPFQGPPKRK